MRLAAASLVFYDHMFIIYGQGMVLITPWVNPGRLSVWVFFIISGYLIAKSWCRDSNIIRFTYNRFLRIWPALCVVVLLTVFLLGPLVSTLSASQYFSHSGTYQYLEILRMKIHYLLPGVFENNPLKFSVNGSLWTLPLEVKCYIILAVLGIIGLLKNKILLPTLLVLLMCIFFYEFYFQKIKFISLDSRKLIEYGTFFCFGAILCLFDEVIQKKRLLIIACSILIFFVCYWYEQYLLAFFLTFPPIIILVGTSQWYMISDLGKWGDFSYGVYIYAFPIQQTTWLFFKDSIGFYPLMIVAYALTFFVAFLSWHFVEYPMLNLKKKLKTQLLYPKFTNKA